MVAVAAAFVAASPAAAVDRTFRVAHVFNLDHPVHKGLELANAQLKERSNGRFALQIFPSGTFANYRDAVTAVRTGTLDLAPLDSAIDYLPSLECCSPPLRSGITITGAPSRAATSTATFSSASAARPGVKQLPLYTFGFRFVTTRNTPAKTPEEFSGLKLRVVNFPPYPEAATILNATGTPLPIGDVYLALSSGVADGQENPLTQIAAMKFHEVQRYLIETRHMLATSGLAMSRRAWNALGAADKAIIEDVFNAAAAEIDRLVIEGEQDLFKKLVNDHGMRPIEVDRSLFMARAPLVFKKHPEFRDLYDRIQAIK
jgi:TRAP-type C4-dicarboxylate transport system substrate-binding protein